MEDNIKVYVQVDKNNVITEIASSIQDIDFTNWIQIDEGQDDKFAHAQNNYFTKEKPLRNFDGKYNYKLVDGKVVELTEEEKASLFPIPVVTLTIEERIAMLENLQLQQQGVI